MIATHSNRNIGVDIEKIGNRILKIRPKFLNDNELDTISDTDIPFNLLAWTAKEALFKAIPHAEIDFREHLHINFPIKEENGMKLYTAFETRTANHTNFNLTTYTLQNHIVSIAIENENK